MKLVYWDSYGGRQSTTSFNEYVSLPAKGDYQKYAVVSNNLGVIGATDGDRAKCLYP